MPRHVPKVSIVMLHWRGLADTQRCLASLSRLVYPNWDLVLVLNGADEEDGQVLRAQLPASAHVIALSRNSGFAAGCNIGATVAIEQGSDFVLLLNNDTEVDPDLLTALTNSAAKDSSIGILGAKTYNIGTNLLQFTVGDVNMWRGWAKNRGSARRDVGQFDQPTDAQFVQGSCLMARSSLIQHIGLLDETFFAYWEETDLCFRARRAGYRVIYEPRARVWHQSSRVSPSPLRLYYLLRNNIYFVSKHARWFHWFTFVPFFIGYSVPAQATRAFLKYPRATAGAVGRGIADGVALVLRGGRTRRRLTRGTQREATAQRPAPASGGTVSAESKEISSHPAIKTLGMETCCGQFIVRS